MDIVTSRQSEIWSHDLHHTSQDCYV